MEDIRKNRTRFFVAGSLIVALLSLAIGVVMWQVNASYQEERIRVLHETEQRAQQLNSAVANRVGVFVRNVDFVIFHLRREFGVNDTRFKTLSETLLSAFPAGSLLQLSIADARGNLVYSNLGLIEKVSISDREHFKVHLDGSDRLFISKPLLGRVSKTWSIQMSRPIYRNEKFAGVIVMSLAPPYLSQLLTTLELEPQDSIALFDSEGTFLARNRELSSLIGKTLTPARPFMETNAAPRGTYRTTSFDDGSDRSFAWQRLEGTNLVTVVGLDLRSVLKPLDDGFRQERFNTGVLAGALLALGLAALLMLSHLSRAQLELAESEARFRSLTKLSSDGYWEQDENFRFTLIEGALRLSTGLAQSGYLGKTRWELPATNMSPEDWEKHRAMLAAHLSFHNLEFRRPEINGTTPWVAISGEPVFDDKGVFRGYRGIGRNITQQKLAEEALREREDRLRAIFENEPECVKVVAPDGRLLEMNRTGLNIIGAESFEAINGRKITDLILPEHVAAYERLHRSVFEGNSGQLEFEIKTLKGGRRWLETHAAPLRDADGRVTALLGITRDITDRRIAEETRDKLEIQLRQAQKMEALGTLAGGIAHDFNNLLAAILGNVSFARTRGTTDKSVYESLVEIEKASLQARELVRQILSFSRTQPQELRALKLEEIATAAIKLLRPTLPAAIEIATHFSPESPSIMADAGQIHQIIMNLCTNAWHAIGEQPGRIDVSISSHVVDDGNCRNALPPGVYAKLSVSDGGKGMNAETVERIFDPFFTTKAPGEGTGLGLSVVSNIIRNHGGHIFVSSEPGQGSTFELYFPSVKDEVNTQSDVLQSPVQGNGKRVLFVDDQEPLVLMATRLLGWLGYQVRGFTLVDEALSVFREDPAAFDMVVTDLNMPKISGLEVAAAVLAIRPDMPVALVSGHVTDAVHAKAAEIGIREVILKPMAFDEMAAALQRMQEMPGLAAQNA